MNFNGCSTRTGFFARLARCFGLSAAVTFNGHAWKAFCERLSLLTRGEYSVRIRLYGMEQIYNVLPKECETMLRILRAAGKHGIDLRSEAVIGNAKWQI